MRAVKYLEYRAFIAALLLYPCSSPMELNLTVVSMTPLIHAINTHDAMTPQNSFYEISITISCVAQCSASSTVCCSERMCHNSIYLKCDTLAPYRHTIKTFEETLHDPMRWLRLNETNFQRVVNHG